MAGTAMAVPVFEGENDSNDYRMSSSSGSPFLGTSKRSSTLQAFKVAMRELRLLDFYYMRDVRGGISCS